MYYNYFMESIINDLILTVNCKRELNSYKKCRSLGRKKEKKWLENQNIYG
jgi:hypothetical protein